MDADKKTARRGRPREFDRERALCLALELFWELGYVNTTMSQLCEKMGIKSPSLYCAFGNKASLFLEALAYYRKKYWEPVLRVLEEEKNLYEATKKFFDLTASVLLLPEAPCGCLTVYSALTLPACESEILNAVNRMRAATRRIFRERLMRAVRDGQLAADADIPAITGALFNFFEGLSLQARDGYCLAELKAIAVRAVRLLPAKPKST